MKKNGYIKRINDGKITQEAGKVFIDNDDKTIKKYIERRKKLSDELLRDTLNCWPIPNIKSMLNRIGEQRPHFFAIMDITSGYHQAPLAKASL